MSTDIKEALRSLSYGLYIITSAADGKRNAMLASWVSQVSFDPPRIMVAVKKTRLTHAMLKSAGGFGLMVVQRGKERELSAYKGPDAEHKFDGRTVEIGAGGAPLLGEYLAAFDLKIVDTVDTGDHTLFIGEVLSARSSGPGIPATNIDYGKTYIGDY
jgi:flavin reductase (DIM6/NTAB) family NADH-FMN oxidoreductase RutF